MVTIINNVFEYVDNLPFKKLGQDKLREVMTKLGNPVEDIHIAHIAGTNGKGSTTNYLSNIIESMGYKVGTFTSPAITCSNDRIQINGEVISTEDFTKYVEELKPFTKDYDLSRFDIYFFVTCLYFKERVDYAIFEVGVGGLHDSTNVLNPDVCGITNVSLDHQDLLGESIEEIAAQKLGIKKEGVPMVVGYSSSQDIIRIVADDENIKYLNKPNPQVGVPLFQVENQHLAGALAKELGITKEYIKKGLISPRQWPGRYEWFKNIILDGAHNADGINGLIKTVGSVDKILFSCLDSKDAEQMIIELSEIGEVYLTEFDAHKKVIDAKKLSEELGVNYIKSYDEFIKEIKSNERILITGSLYFISEVRKSLI